ncbi:hypothetical protein D3C81_1138650 [compost metagenome]
MPQLAGVAVINGRHRGVLRCTRERQQEPQQNGERQDDAANALEEDHRALVKAHRQVTRMRQTVRRQLQHQRVLALVAAEFLHRPGHHQRAQDAGQVQAEQHQTLLVEHAPHRLGGNEGTDQQRVHRQARRAGHQRRYQNRGQAISRILDGTRGHDARHRAGEAGQQRDERTPGQTGRRHHAIQQERRTRQIARLFQRQDEGEQDQDLRQEHQHAADTGNDAVHQQAAQRTFREGFGHHRPEPGKGRLDAIHQWRGPGIDRLEDQEHHHRKRQQPEHRVQQPAVQCVVDLRGAGRHLHGGGENVAHLHVQVFTGHWCMYRR